MSKRKSQLLFSLILFIIASAFILSFPYPLGRQKTQPNFEHEEINNFSSAKKIWTGELNPDEAGYFGWAQIYYETRKTFLYFEEIGQDKIQYLEFYIGDSPERCIFVKVDIYKLQEESLIWEENSRNVTIRVYDGNNKGLRAFVEVLGRRNYSGFTDEDGKFNIENIPPGRYTIKVNKSLLKTSFYTDFSRLNYPIIVTPSLKNLFSEHAEINIHVDHFFNQNIKGAYIYLNQSKKPIGKTDEHGNYTIILPTDRKYNLTVVKETKRLYPPPGSVVVDIDGKLAIANRWAPGYCFLIIPFWISKMIFFINIFMCAIASISTYFIAKRLYDDEVAVISTTLLITCGIAMVMIYLRGMADYASMAFATMGIALLMEANKRKNIFLGFFGGISFGIAVAMRYSAVVILAGPIIYFFIEFIKSIKKSITLKKIFPILAFIFGLSLIGYLIASYNAHLFGGALKSGYQMSYVIENGNVTVTNETMFEKYFNPSFGAIPNIFKRILPQLFLLMPTLFIAPIGLFLDFKRSRTWLLLFWILPILIIYMQLSWVGQIPVEDMRYFLPVLPPTAILSAYSIKRMNSKFFLPILILLIIIGFLMGGYGINFEIHHEGKPPLIAILLAIAVYLLIYGKTIKNIFKN